MSASTRTGLRWIASVLLAALAAGLMALTVVGTWAQRDVLDTAGFTEAVAPLASDPQVQQVLAAEGTTRAMAAIETAVKEQGGFLAPLLESLLPQLQPTISNAVTSAVQSPQFVAAVESSTATLHDELVATLRGQGSGSVTADEQQITVDLAVLKEPISAALEGSQLATLVLDNIDLGTVSVPVPVTRLKAAVAVADVVGWWTPVAGLICLVLAVLVAPRRWAGLMVAGGLMVAAAAVGLLFVARGISTSSAVSQAGQVIATAITERLDDGLWLGLGLLAAAGAVLGLAGAGWGLLGRGSREPDVELPA